MPPSASVTLARSGPHRDRSPETRARGWRRGVTCVTARASPAVAVRRAGGVATSLRRIARQVAGSGRNCRGIDSPSLVGRGSTGGRGRRRRRSMSRHPSQTGRLRVAQCGSAAGAARQGKGMEPPMHTDAHRWSETGMAIYGDRRKINPGDRRRTNPGERRWSGGPCPIGEYRCASVVPNSCLVARRSRLPEGLVITTGRAPRTVGWARQTRERAAVTKPACTMRPIAKPRRPTGLLPAPQGCGTRHSKQELNANAEGIHAEHANGPGAGAAFHSRHGTTEPGEPAPRRLLS